MTAARITSSFAAHAVCVAAGARDSLRAVQFFMRDLSNVDEWGHAEPQRSTFLSRFVARLARLADRLMTWGANVSIALLLPSWRKLPSPFQPGMMRQVADAIGEESLVTNPLFNAYFFRAANHILQRFSEPPFLVLEHRVDAARRALAADAQRDDTRAAFLGRALIELVAAGPIARTGAMKSVLLSGVDPNISVFATACIALLFAEDGKPTAELDEDQFFAVVSALIAPRLPRIDVAARARDNAALLREFKEIETMY